MAMPFGFPSVTSLKITRVWIHYTSTHLNVAFHWPFEAWIYQIEQISSPTILCKGKCAYKHPRSHSFICNNNLELKSIYSIGYTKGSLRVQSVQHWMQSQLNNMLSQYDLGCCMSNNLWMNGLLNKYLNGDWQRQSSGRANPAAKSTLLLNNDYWTRLVSSAR